MPAGLDPVFELIAEQAVQTIYEINIPIPDQRNSVRRPSRSTRIAAEKAAPKLKIWRSPLMRVWSKEPVMPTVSRTSDR